MDVKSLKDKILQLALQGKLVTQDINDEPASVLVDRIKEEKEKLIKDKKIKKEKPLPTITEEEAYVELPNGWEWCRLNDIYRFIDYRGKTPNKIAEGIPLVTAKNVKMGYIDYTIEEFLSEEEFEDRKSRGISQKGDILFTTEAPMGNVAIADLERFSAGQRLITFQQYTEENLLINKLFMYFIMSKQFQNQLLENKTGTTVYGIKAEKLKKILIPIPPLEEQKRIVAKIDKLFALIDELECDKNDLFKIIMDTKNKVLQLAIQGKIVEQNEQCEPASVLLEKIQNEKEQLIKNKIMKKTKPLPAIQENEIPYELPTGWSWVRLGEIIELLSGRDLTREDYNDNNIGIPYIMGASNIINGTLKIERWTENPTVIGKKNDLLISVKGTVGKLVIQDLEEVHLSRQIMGLRTFYGIDVKYLMYFMQNHVKYLQESAKGFIPGISREDILLSIFPLPPYEEQKRIVSKAENLFSIINEIEGDLISLK
ncbi:restriction endonuclease subunit S [Heyndrickxia ginsengihumi]|uniref:restriction endonuclease subunit S n=1 Tax=Heyndrickxia ginsengihumi TaxID=363870 RepID=UPI00203BF3DD|nr:restriction endonuclease subunit S [Heyndrickxia ginsengihumi]MCM3024643.1 restriction endonuclease subunit S [Heyndrickxia ginsengihumi]